MDPITGAAIVQAMAAVVIVCLTWRLARTATGALSAANSQAAAASATITEMQRDRHIGAVPMLAITLNPLDTTQVNRILSVVYITNASDQPALNIRVTMSEALDQYQAQDLRLATPSPLPIIGPHEKANLPVDMSRFTRAEPPRTVRTDWVCIRIDYEGLLGAKVYQEWYWEPYEWEGVYEPVPGHGEKLLLSRVRGTSGADPNVQDLSWHREP